MGFKCTIYMLPSPATHSGWRAWWRVGCSLKKPMMPSLVDIVTPRSESFSFQAAEPPEQEGSPTLLSSPFCPLRAPLTPQPRGRPVLPLSPVSSLRGLLSSTSVLHSDSKSRTRAGLLTPVSPAFCLELFLTGTHALLSRYTPSPPNYHLEPHSQGISKSPVRRCV